MGALLRVFVSRSSEREARRHAEHAATGHQHHTASSDEPISGKLLSAQAWSDVAHNFRGDWQMLYKEITIGFLLAGFLALLPPEFFNRLFITDAEGPLRTLENVIVGPIIAVLTFVCSVGNVPLAAVLWSGGISFAGVMSFIFADLIIIPIIAAYRKYYGTGFALKITALMFVAMVAAGLIVDWIFTVAGLVPGTRPSAMEVMGDLNLGYKLVLNSLALVAFLALMYLTVRRGAVDPVCGMSVDRAKAHTYMHSGTTHYFCSEGCRDCFAREPESYLGAEPHRAHAAAGHHGHGHGH